MKPVSSGVKLSARDFQDVLGGGTEKSPGAPTLAEGHV